MSKYKTEKYRIVGNPFDLEFTIDFEASSEEQAFRVLSLLMTGQYSVKLINLGSEKIKPKTLASKKTPNLFKRIKK